METMSLSIFMSVSTVSILFVGVGVLEHPLDQPPYLTRLRRAYLSAEVHMPYVTYAVGGWETHLSSWCGGDFAM